MGVPKRLTEMQKGSEYVFGGPSSLCHKLGGKLAGIAKKEQDLRGQSY